MSSDEDPQHDYCPHGEKSWCFHNNQAIAFATDPPSHRDNLKNTMSTEVAKMSTEVAKSK